MAPIARSDSNSRESSVSGPKKLPTLDEIRSIRKLVKRNTDGKTKPFTPMNPLVSKKTFREGSGSPVADLQLLTRESSSTDRTLASNIDSDKPYTSAPFTSSSLVPAAHSPTRCVEVNGQIGLSPPMPADHRSTRSAQRISDQEQLNLLDIVTDSRDPSMFDLGYREPRSTEFISSLPNEQGSALPTMDSVAPKPRPSIGIDHISPLNIKPSLADNKNMAVDNTAPVCCDCPAR
jgi:hypothetical protein